MPKRRSLVAMTEEEQEAYLREGHTLQVASIGASGHPHLVAMWYALLDGKVAFATYEKSQKVINLRKNPKISVMLESGETYDQLRGLVIEGTARIIEGNIPLAAQVMMTSGSRKPGEFITAEPNEGALKRASKRVIVVVEPEDIYSWDHRKLGGTY